jgi:two-component system, LytTR family, sensor kinase
LYEFAPFPQGAFLFKFSILSFLSQKCAVLSHRWPAVRGITEIAGDMDSINKRWYRSRWASVTFHVLAWLLLFSLPLFSHREPDQTGLNWKAVLNTRSLVFDISCITFFYLNAFVLIPSFLNRKKMGIYIALLCGLFVVYLNLLNISPMQGHKREFLQLFFFTLFSYLFFWAMSTVYWFVADKIRTEQLLKEKENENLKTELSFLRSQVSPHFLFNVLNNMVAMARLKSDMLEPSLIRLSGLMRYMLYESDDASVTLIRETEYINSYIELQKIRFAKSLCIKVDMDPGDNQRIEPMLLIPFIENAFKHGTGNVSDPVIDISLKISEGLIDFRVKNKYDPANEEIKDKVSGIGLPNVIRRLNLLYDQKHMVTINKEHGWFTVSLQIKLH